MNKAEININKKNSNINLAVTVYSLNTVIVGSGAAGLNAADRLHHYGQDDIAIVTEGIKLGTSRNTGSDKQTYYKLTLSGKERDSVYAMAETLFAGGSMDGDLALVEAALSPAAFYHLVEIGVPFPHNRYGEYVGYKTDHDPARRATSAGPLTSKFMTERLEEQVSKRGIKVFDGYQVIGVLTDKKREKAVGLLALNLEQLNEQKSRYILFNCINIIYATGGPAGLFSLSVYPAAQNGATGLALEAGVQGKNLTEIQCGIASIGFRWNLSGTYQQVLPRYVSTTEDGSDPREFLNDYFPDPGKMLDAVFLKGYQWPFDPRKVTNYGSSLIDLLVYQEQVIKGRRVWLDYRSNPEGVSQAGSLDFSLLGEEAYQYLKSSQVLFGSPLERLLKMNQPAYQLYLEQGIDLAREMLEIGVCIQHCNGGLQGNLWWESNLKHFFPVGEVNGSHGVYRPGGSALNAGQVGSSRAALYITHNYREEPLDLKNYQDQVAGQVLEKIELAEGLLKRAGQSNITEMKKDLQEKMTGTTTIIRDFQQIKQAIIEIKGLQKKISEFISIAAVEELREFFITYDMIIAQQVILESIANYIKEGGGSRGSYLIHDQQGQLPLASLDDIFRFKVKEEGFSEKIQRCSYQDGECLFNWDQVKAIPDKEDWFENVWQDYRNGEVT